jgi:SPP1 gp7 family putative phage head morphogenesis protein
MDAESMRQATREAVRKKFGRKRLLVSKALPHYPANLEREYVRAADAYMAAFKNTLAAHLPNIRALLEQGGVRADADSGGKEETASAMRTGAEIAAFSTALELELAKILNDFTERQGLSDLRKRVAKLAGLARKLSVREWKRAVRRTLGIDIMEGYYDGLKFSQLLDRWAAANVGLIKTIPQETLGKMRDIVKAGYLRGADTKSVAREIQDAYGTGKNHARFIARDQMAKLNADIAREQQTDAGVSEYVWRTAGDRRVRDSHAALNGKRFKHSDPPVVDERTGRRAGPGQDFQCRCVALPVFDLDTVVLPWEKEAGGGGQH